MKTETYKLLSQQQFKAQWNQLLEQEQTAKTIHDASFDQQKAAFLRRSGWTQRQIAAEIGKSQKWVDQYLRFGAFLESVSTSGTQDFEIPPNLTERLFRRAWASCRGPTDEARFEMIPEWLEANFEAGRPRVKPEYDKKIAEKIAAECDDGKWRTLDQIARKVDCDIEEVKPKLTNMVAKGSYGTYVQTREFNDELQYKIRKGSGRKIQLDVILDELEPLLKELEAEGKKEHMAEYCPSVILNLTARIRKLLRDRCV